LWKTPFENLSSGPFPGSINPTLKYPLFLGKLLIHVEIRPLGYHYNHVIGGQILSFPYKSPGNNLISNISIIYSIFTLLPKYNSLY